MTVVSHASVSRAAGEPCAYRWCVSTGSGPVRIDEIDPDRVGEFAAVTRDAWAAAVAGVLSKGQVDPVAPEQAVKHLESVTEDGIVVSPLYDAGSAAAAETGQPGRAPFVRGRLPVCGRTGWDIRSQVPLDGRAGAEFAAAAELERGATSIWLVAPDLSPHAGVAGDASRSGVAGDAFDAGVLGDVLDGVQLDLAPVAVSVGAHWEEAAAALVALWSARDVAPGDRRGSVGADPAGWAVTYGERAGAHAAGAAGGRLDDLVGWVERLEVAAPEAQLVTLDGPRFAAAGATIGQQMGALLADGVATLRAMISGGVDARRAFRVIELRIAVTGEQFLTIAALRALRRCWSRVADVIGDAELAGGSPVHAVTSHAAMTRYDPWVNALRSTVACFAAAVGGADAVTVIPHDRLSGLAATELGRRVARNTQLVLELESHLSAVADPAGGSWYVEALTGELARVAWGFLQEIEQAGGLVAAGHAGVLSTRFGEAISERRTLVDTRARAITGVTEFPDPSERRPPGDTSDGYRYAAEIEALRSRVDALADRPVVHLATIGPAASYGPRVTYARNFFQIAGFGTELGPITEDPAEVAEAAIASGRAAVCVCGTDDAYRAGALAVVEAIRAGARERVVVVAGRPDDLVADLERAGAVAVAAGADLVAVLTPLVEMVVTS